jgi:lipid-binding SYLF domain-containing protein
METPDHAIPQELLELAKCIAIIPGQKKAGFIVAAEYGKGLADPPLHRKGRSE